MSQELEQKILQLVVERRILSPKDLQNVRTEWEESGVRAEGPSSRLVDLLIEKGMLEPKTVETLMSEVLTLTSAGRPEAGATDDVPENFGRYQRLEFLEEKGWRKCIRPTIRASIGLLR